ncbi:hypothetical protein [Nocardiopsis lucentensis]|uniref:hypothetical protein n=1 Tax=Nocardiopsis lucentensis TaxID=53441 RepID=UPI000475BA18|nr:hypothetical protein [Nocardiopsis lucentensis]
MANFDVPEQTALADLRQRHPGWRIRRAHDGGHAWIAVHGPDADDVVRVDTLEVLGVRLHLTRYVPRPRSEATP